MTVKRGKLIALIALTTAAALTGCGSADDEPAAVASVAAPAQGTTTPAEDSAPAAKPDVPEACDLLSAADIKKLTGLVASVGTDTPDRCNWVVEKPKDSHYHALTIGVEGYASAEEAKKEFHWFVKEPVQGIGEEASIGDNGLLELTVRVGAAKMTISEQNPAITRDVLLELGRVAARNAA
ncbi:hypothetical protein AB0J80_06520 [Actinoplanes sp. NPDC049548]|uniref:hypothetical protein n=1 Tax=Actinoplanes sp. NPDC049548 TaxID=3155152 RepID=UPI00343A3CF8